MTEIFGSNPFDIVPHLVAMTAAYLLALPVGWNREKEERSAGLRTFPLVAVAACGFVQAAESLAVGDGSPVRSVAARGEKVDVVAFVGDRRPE